MKLLKVVFRALLLYAVTLQKNSNRIPSKNKINKEQNLHTKEACLNTVCKREPFLDTIFSNWNFSKIF